MTSTRPHGGPGHWGPLSCAAEDARPTRRGLGRGSGERPRVALQWGRGPRSPVGVEVDSRLTGGGYFRKV